MKRARGNSPALRWLAAGAGLTAALYASRAGFTWLCYGHPPVPDTDQTDPLLDEFIPKYEVVERHHVQVAAPAATALAAACDMDLVQSPIIRAIFKTRELVLGAQPGKVRSPRTLLAWAKELGWAVLAEIPDRKVVLGAVTRPWDANPVFRPLPAQEFAGFHEPGFAKIVWTLRADPINTAESVARTETRVATTDHAARKAFRRYWSLVSPGVEVIRWVSLQLVKSEAEGRIRRSRATAVSCRPGSCCRNSVCCVACSFRVDAVPCGGKIMFVVLPAVCNRRQSMFLRTGGIFFRPIFHEFQAQTR
jgi:hypothetical protein